MPSFPALLAILLLPGLAAAQAPPVGTGAPYAATREALVAAGWEPLRDPEADRCTAGDRRCEGRPEMVACAGTGLGQCLFAWRRGAVAIEVITAGPEAIVSGWRGRR
jgi:hypothetical protein